MKTLRILLAAASLVVATPSFAEINAGSTPSEVCADAFIVNTVKDIKFHHDQLGYRVVVTNIDNITGVFEDVLKCTSRATYRSTPDGEDTAMILWIVTFNPKTDAYNIAAKIIF